MMDRIRRECKVPTRHCPHRIVDASQIPVFINNRDRLSTVRTTVNWLLRTGTQRIVILDNDSSYPPLLEYYRYLPKGVTVEYLRQNAGPWAFWDKNMHLQQSIPYVVTDSDLVPDEGCSGDLIHKLNVLLNERPESGKVGPGLRIDDVPQFDELTKRNGCGMPEQLQYWTRRYNSEAFLANIDTTFALYAAGSNGKVGQWFDDPNNLRMDIPYIFRHIPWYFTPPITDEEEIYYRIHCKKGWSHSYGI